MERRWDAERTMSQLVACRCSQSQALKSGGTAGASRPPLIAPECPKYWQSVPPRRVSVQGKLYPASKGGVGRGSAR